MLSINAQFPPKMVALFQPYVYQGKGYGSVDEFKCEHGGELAPVDDLQHARFKTFYGGRGAGRSWGVVRAALLCGMGGGPAGVIPKGLRTLCVREIQNSLQESIKKTLADQIVELQLAEYYEVLDAVIRGRKGTTAQGTEFFFEGLRRNTSKIKSYEGIGLVIAEEAAPISYTSWKDLIPTIRLDPPGGPLGLGAEFWINFNPELEEDETYQRFVVHPPANSIKVRMNFRDNPWFPESLRTDMATDRARSEDMYQHVWEGECRQNLEGAVYAEELRLAQLEGRIGEFDYNRMVAVSVYFDLGHSDYTAMWFVQRRGWDFAIIDYYHNNRQHIDHYLKILSDRAYTYDMLWLPHDARSHTLGSKMTIEEQIRDKGYDKRTRIVPKLSIAEGINAVRTVFGSCYFDRARCAEGLKMLRGYIYDKDDDGLLSKKPLHNLASNGADAFRYFGVACRMPTGEPNIELPPVDGRVAESMKKLGGRFASLVGGGSGWMR